MTSFSGGDIAHGYCGNCHEYADEVKKGGFLLSHPDDVEKIKADPEQFEDTREMLEMLLKNL